MRILLLPAYFYPEQAASSYLGDNIRQAMCEAGCTLKLYAPMPTRGISNEVREEYKKRKVEHWHDGKLEIHRFSMYGEGKNPILRALRYVFCWSAQFCKGLRAKDIDLIYLASTPPIQGVLGGLLKKMKKIPFVYNLQDIFPDSLAGTGLAKKDGLLWKIGRVIEDFTYRNADKIIVISEDFKRNIMAKGVPEDKIVVIYNWVDEEAVRPVQDKDNDLFEELGINRDKFNVVYAGNLGNAQNVRILIETALLLQEYSDIQFLIFGTGGQELEYKKLVESMALKNVSFYPIQPYEKVAQVYGLGNVCVVSCKEGLGGSAMPSKTWSIMASGRAVLANFDEGDLKNILEANQCGMFTKAGDKKAFKQAILDLYHNREQCELLGRNGRKFILNNLTRAVGTQKYVDVIKSFEKTKCYKTMH
jgi:glycosyltransferase involved in cell wall biosynthesis